MTSPRLLSSFGVILGLLVGCATGTSESDVADAPEPSPRDERAVTAEDIEQNPSEPIPRLLATRFPGVVVTQSPNGGIAIRIRGRSSILGSNEPLYVIDGMTIEPGPGGALFGINPYDIETIHVLTDPANTSMYGVRGANGVIVIETKQPERPNRSDQ